MVAAKSRSKMVKENSFVESEARCNPKAFVLQSQVETMVSNSSAVLRKFINTSAELKAENDKLKKDNIKLTDTLVSVSKSSNDNKQAVADSMNLFATAEEEYERLIIEHAKKLENNEVDDLLESLGFL